MMVDSLSDVDEHENQANLLDEVEDRLLDVNANLYKKASRSKTARASSWRPVA